MFVSFQRGTWLCSLQGPRGDFQVRDILSQATFWVPEECYLHKLPRADFGVCFQNIQPTKWIKHAKKGEEVGNRNKSTLSGTKLLTPTFHPDWPCALALRAQTGPSHHLEEKKVCKHSLHGSL